MKRRSIFKRKKGGLPVLVGQTLRRNDGHDYIVKSLDFTGTPNHPYPHLIVLRKDADLVGVKERVDPAAFNVEFSN